ncbi:MAG: hypothetical protein IIB60_05075 [Planctomycetes bacterium]|nr:hypothetical protein [Planctomycetota bacterium]
MVFEGVVRNRAVLLPPEADLPEGAIVRIEVTPFRRFNDLVELGGGTWEGDGADRVVAEIYALRSSAPPRASLGS